MDTRARLVELMDERHWSEYRLAIESGLSQSTVANIFNRSTTPSVATLECICAGLGVCVGLSISIRLGITLSQFFAEGTLVELTAEQQEMFAAWSTLSREQKDVLQQLIQVMKKKDA